MKKLFLLSFTALIMACTTQQSQNNSFITENPGDSVASDKKRGENPIPEVANTVYNKVKNIIDTTQEYKEAWRVIDSASNHKSAVSMMVDPNQNTKDSVFSVYVGRNHSDRFERFFAWEVDVKNRKVVGCVDAISGQTIPLQEYRKRNKENGFSW